MAKRKPTTKNTEQHNVKIKNHIQININDVKKKRKPAQKKPKNLGGAQVHQLSQISQLPQTPQQQQYTNQPQYFNPTTQKDREQPFRALFENEIHVPGIRHQSHFSSQVPDSGHLTALRSEQHENVRVPLPVPISVRVPSQVPISVRVPSPVPIPVPLPLPIQPMQFIQQQTTTGGDHITNMSSQEPAIFQSEMSSHIPEVAQFQSLQDRDHRPGQKTITQSQEPETHSSQSSSGIAAHNDSDDGTVLTIGSKGSKVSKTNIPTRISTRKRVNPIETGLITQNTTQEIQPEKQFAKPRGKKHLMQELDTTQDQDI